MAECRVQQVRGGPRAHPGRGSRPGGLGVAAALRGPGSLPGLAPLAAGLQRAPRGAPGQVQDRSHQRHRLLHHVPRLRLPGRPGARGRYQAGEVHLHPGRVSAEAQRDQQPAEESAAAEDHFLRERHGQRHHCTPQAEEPGIFVSE